MTLPGADPLLLGPLTSFGVGGPARRIVQAAGRADLPAVLATVPERDADSFFVMSGGTNLLVADTGFHGTVLLVSGGTADVVDVASGHTDLVADAGVWWDDLVAESVARGLTGIEMLSGVPGRVGAAPMQNIGAYGQQVADVITAVGVVDRASLEGREVPVEECGMAFRSSRFKTDWRDRYVVTHVCFRLHDAERHPPPPSTYTDIERHFAASGRSPVDVAARRAAVLDTRRAKSVLLDPADPLSRSAGSFFINPEVPESLAESLAADAAGGPRTVQYLEGRAAAGGASTAAAPDGGPVKRVPAAWLLRRAGFRPGDRWGDVQISDKHLLVLVARPGATARNVWFVACHLRQRVLDATGVLLRPEPVLVGDLPDFDPVAFERDYPFSPSTAGSADPAWLR